MCPRCGTAAPPAETALVSCTTCKLSFDPKSEPVGTRIRRRPGTQSGPEQRAPGGMVLTREPGEWTIKIPDQRMHGVFYGLVGTLLAWIFFQVRGIPGQETIHLVGLGGFALIFLYLGLAKITDDLTIRIDQRRVVALLRPVRLQRDIWLGRNEITKIRAEKTDSSKFPWVVFADTPRGPVALAGIRRGGERGAEEATFLAEAVRDGLAATADSIT